ncbi:DUF885 domain-containing protein [Zavarzinella formosa]|uniref:DUF885 domain-containing protein n=1 Tax=Zavarzinella formosa TaxID=360055 RepID=UPI0002F04290|nr:DUF885 domain-containing protein [Zavarzinella formosa]
MMNRLLVGWLLLVGCPVMSHASEDEKFAAFFKTYLEDLMKSSPVEASRLGDHRYDDRIEDLSPKARLASLDKQKAILAKLAKDIDYKALSRDSQIDLEILRDVLKRNIWLEENTRLFEEDPRTWGGYLTESVYLILTQSTEEKSKRVRSAAARIEAVPKVVADAKAGIKSPPKVFVETAIRQNRGAINFYKKTVFELTGETPTVSVMAEPAKKAVIALEDYQVFLEKTVLPRSVENWRIGRAKFDQKLAMELDAGVTADEVLKEALAEADRVRNEMYVISRQLWTKEFPKKPLPPDDAEGRRRCIQEVLASLGKDHGEVTTLVPDAKTTADEIKVFMKANDILRLPDPDRCAIVEMPEFQRGNSTAYLNPAPPLDPKAESQYAVSPPPKEWDDRRVQSYLQEYNRSMMKLLTIHEAYPGHYVQLEYSNRHPSLVRRVFQSGIFAEGWAVYTEQMMLDQGFGNGDLSLRLHQLKWYLRAVVNAILDHKMHCEEMIDADALKLLTEGAFQTEGEAIGKILRSKLSSCQLSTYFVGRMAFYRLRQSISREMGKDFDLGRYHEAVLDHGTIPVKYLPEVVRARLKKPR